MPTWIWEWIQTEQRGVNHKYIKIHNQSNTHRLLVLDHFLMDFKVGVTKIMCLELTPTKFSMITEMFYKFILKYLHEL